jgi:membrane-bound lytic murein transglycosylase F
MPITITTATVDGRFPLVDRLLRGAALGVLCAILVACPRAMFHAQETAVPHDSLGEILARGTLRVVTRADTAALAAGTDGPAGIEHELARAFAARLGVRAEVMPLGNAGELYAALDTGFADIAATGVSAQPDLTRRYRYSAPWLGVDQQAICRGGPGAPASITELVGRRVVVLAHGRSAAALRRAQASLPELAWQEATRAETSALLQDVADGKTDCAVVESQDFYTHEGLFPALAVAFALPEPEQLAWAVPRGEHDDRLRTAIARFLSEMEASGDLALLRERFYGYLPEVNRVALNAFAERAVRQLPRLEPLLRRVGEQEGVDWRLLAAMSYQESHWNPAAVSRKGAAGMMMLTPRAAREVGVHDRTDMEQSLRGGARYLLRLMERMDPAIAAEDRELFALAAYNIGPAHLEDARTLARVRGADPNRWADVAEQLPLLARREWRQHLRSGYARGLETAGFVNQVRQYRRFLIHRDETGTLYQLAANTPRAGASDRGG